MYFQATHTYMGAGAPGEPAPHYPGGMKTIQTYKWRVLWLGRWATTRHHASAEQIRIEHPEAVPVLSTLIERQVPETEAERASAQAGHAFSINAGPRIPPQG
jgi:hypothetical protein